MESNNTNAAMEGSFNQAMYQQKRINDLLSGIDLYYTNPMAWNVEKKSYNYNIIFANLIGCFMSASPLFTAGENKDMLDRRGKIIDQLQLKPIHKKVRTGILVTPGSWNDLDNLIIKFRMELERLMHIHGMGNPLKDDPRKSVLME